MTFDKIKELLAEQLDADIDEMTMDTDIAKDLGADSLDVVELLSQLEDEFGIVRTISDIFHNTRLYYLRKEYEKAGKISEFFKLTSEQLEEKLSDDDSDVWEKALEDVKELQEEYGITGE